MRYFTDRTGARHTLQGSAIRAVTQVRGGDDEHDGVDWKSRKSRKGGSMQNLRTIFGRGCWCGLKNGHDWPGKAEGEPHPRGDRGWRERCANLALLGASADLVDVLFKTGKWETLVLMERMTPMQIQKLNEAVKPK